MKKSLLIGLLTLLVAAPLLTIAVQKVLADPDPTVGLGYVFDVSPNQGIDPSKKWLVKQGDTVTVTLEEATDLSVVDVFVTGSYMDGTPWKIKVLDDYTIVGGTITFSFTVPATAGCTGVFQYRNFDETGDTHVAAAASASQGTQEAGGYKVVDDQGNPVPCGVPGVAEFSTASAVVTSIGLIAALAVRRRYKKK